MKLEQIEERITLFPDYLKTTIDNTTHGTDITWWDMVKPQFRQPCQTFDQWLYSHRHYDLVDFDNWQPYTPIGKPIFLSSSIQDRYLDNQFKEMWNNSNWNIIDYPVKTTGLWRYFKPNYGVGVDPYAGKSDLSVATAWSLMADKETVMYHGRDKSNDDLYKEALNMSQYYGPRMEDIQNANHP